MRESLPGATESMHHNEDPVQPKIIIIIKCKLHGFQLCTLRCPGTAQPTWQSMMFQKIFEGNTETLHMDQTQANHQSKQSQCPLETSVHSLLMTPYLCKVDLSDTTVIKKKKHATTAQTSLAILQEEQVVVSHLLLGKVMTCLTGARIPLEVTVVI